MVADARAPLKVGIRDWHSPMKLPDNPALALARPITKPADVAYAVELLPQHRHVALVIVPGPREGLCIDLSGR